MKFQTDRLAPGYTFPVSIRDLKAVLRRLPPGHIRGISSVRLSGQQSRVDGMWLGDGRIDLRWAVDLHSRRRIGNRSPSAPTIAEWARFGGQCVKDGDVYYGYWPDPNQLRRYVLFVFLHEIGHQVGGTRRYKAPEAEAFADAYAERYLRQLP